jgi:hypothetical protein
MEYVAPAWHSSLTQGQSDGLERIQKRACLTILGGYSGYTEALQILSLGHPSCTEDLQILSLGHPSCTEDLQILSLGHPSCTEALQILSLLQLHGRRTQLCTDFAVSLLKSQFRDLQLNQSVRQELPQPKPTDYTEVWNGT